MRAQARLLRQRLEEYFEHECPACPTIILIPKGGYVPVFERRPERPIARTREAIPTSEIAGGAEQTEAASGISAPGQDRGEYPSFTAASPGPAAAISSSPRVRLGRIGRRRSVGWSLTVLAALLLVGAAVWRVRYPENASSPQSSLWGSLFTPNRPVVIVPSDDGLVLSEEMRRAPVTLDEYLSGSYLRQGGGSPAEGGPLTSGWLSSHQYTSTADLNLAMRLNRLPEAATAHVETRYARLLRLDDLKNNNVILIGGIGANPWVGLFSRELNFDVNYDWKTAQGYVVNKHPQPGEQARYLEDHGDHSARSYGVLAYLPGIAGQGSALLFEGSGMAGTEAAADFPFSGEGIYPVARPAANGGWRGAGRARTRRPALF